MLPVMSGSKNLKVSVSGFSDEVAEAAQVVEVPIPEPGEGDVLVRVYLRTINPADVYSIQGQETSVTYLLAATLYLFPIHLSFPTFVASIPFGPKAVVCL